MKSRCYASVSILDEIPWLTVHLKLVHVDLVEVELPLAVPHEDGDVLPLPQPGVVTKPAGQVSLEKEDGIVNLEPFKTILQGDPSRSSKPPVDVKTKVAF